MYPAFTFAFSMSSADDILDSEILRQRAEDLLKNKLKKTVSPLSEADILKLVHELEVHQIELELQNDELQVAKISAQRAAENYIDMFDFAPESYLILSEQGRIRAINLQGAKMLGKERLYLQGASLVSHLETESKLIFNNFLTKTFKSNNKETCEVILLSNGPKVHVRLSGIVKAQNDQCHLIITEIPAGIGRM